MRFIQTGTILIPLLLSAAASAQPSGNGYTPWKKNEAQNRYAVPDKFKNFPIYAWGFTIGPTIAKLYAEWQDK